MTHDEFWTLAETLTGARIVGFRDRRTTTGDLTLTLDNGHTVTFVTREPARIDRRSEDPCLSRRPGKR